MKLPLIRRKLLEKERQNHAKEIVRLIHDQRKAERELKKDLSEVVKGMTKLSLVRDPEKPMWRIVLDFDARSMVYALERGNDRHMVECIAEEIKHGVINELMSINIQRPENLGLGRRW